MLEGCLDTLVRLGTWIIPMFGALAFSGRVMAHLVQEVLQEELYVPAWIEAIAPLKGRWLVLLVASPILVVLFFLLLIGAYLPLLFFTVAAWPLGVIGSAVLLGLCFPIRAVPASKLRP